MNTTENTILTRNSIVLYFYFRRGASGASTTRAAGASGASTTRAAGASSASTSARSAGAKRGRDEVDVADVNPRPVKKMAVDLHQNSIARLVRWKRNATTKTFSINVFFKHSDSEVDILRAFRKFNILYKRCSIKLLPVNEQPTFKDVTLRGMSSDSTFADLVRTLKHEAI
jgi:hypothetical protein